MYKNILGERKYNKMDDKKQFMDTIESLKDLAVTTGNKLTKKDIEERRYYCYRRCRNSAQIHAGRADLYRAGRRGEQENNV